MQGILTGHSLEDEDLSRALTCDAQIAEPANSFDKVWKRGQGESTLCLMLFVKSSFTARHEVGSI